MTGSSPSPGSHQVVSVKKVSASEAKERRVPSARLIVNALTETSVKSPSMTVSAPDIGVPRFQRFTMRG